MISKACVLQDNHHSRNVLNNNKTFELTGFTNNNYWIIPTKPRSSKIPCRLENKRITDEAYETFLKNEIARWIKIQEDIGLDVLVHGEFERNDINGYNRSRAGKTTNHLW